jgi:hypothetical protein
VSNFYIYFNIGYHHIANWGALDHLLFMAALTLRYQFADWKKLLLLITAFTIGHCITLGLCVIDAINISRNWIEFLIPLTIIIAAISNLFEKSSRYKSKFPLIYWLTLFFGLIHGLGFSGDLKMLLGNNDLVGKLFAANLGIETTQIIFVFLLLLIQLICSKIFKINRRDYLLFLSGLILGIALYIAAYRIPF